MTQKKKNVKYIMCFEKKKCQFPRFSSFRFYPIPKIENSEILETLLLLIFLVVYETPNLKTDWKKTQNKNVTFMMCFEKKKCQFPRFLSFEICSISKIENSKILESFLLLKFLVVYETQNLKTDWKMTKNKKRYFYDVIWEEKMPISGVSEFSILPYTWNRKLENLGMFSFISNFYRFLYIKHGKGYKTFHWISN